MNSLKATVTVYTEFNQLLLAQYPFGEKPKVKGEYWQTYHGKATETTFKPISEFRFKEYFERIVKAGIGLRGDVLMLENPLKVPAFNILLNLLDDTIFLLKGDKNEYAVYIRDTAVQLLNWLNTRFHKQSKPKMTTSLLALCMYHLKEARYISGTISEMIEQTKESLLIKEFQISTIRKEYYKIGKSKFDDPLNTDNLLNLMEWLKDYPEALKIARKTLSSYD